MKRLDGNPASLSIGHRQAQESLSLMDEEARRDYKGPAPVRLGPDLHATVQTIFKRKDQDYSSSNTNKFGGFSNLVGI